MVVEQLLKEWIAERVGAVDLNVAARSPKAIAAEIEGYYAEIVSRAQAAALDKTQLLAEKERSLDKALEVISKLEGQLAQVRDKAERSLSDKEAVIDAKDRLLETNANLLARLEAQFGATREALDERVQAAEKAAADLDRQLSAKQEALTKLEKELHEKTRLVDTYRRKFGVIMKAVG